MPQKRNPDAAELVRAKTGRVIGALTGLLIVMKGLPLAYQKDMQEDKQGAMEAFAALSLAVRAMTGMVADLVPDEARMKAAAGEGYATATDLADWLVRTLKMPFRDAHHVTGRIVAEASKQGVPLHELPLKDDAGDRAEDHRGGVGGAVGGSLGEKPHQLWRNRAEECAGAGQGLAQAAGKRAKIGLSRQISLQFHGCPRSRQNRAIFVWCRRIGDFVVNRSYQPDIVGMGHHPALSAAVLALGGCGRKGGARPAAERSGAGGSRGAGRYRSRAGRASRACSIRPTAADAPPAAPKGRKKAFVLDPLLD